MLLCALAWSYVGMVMCGWMAWGSRGGWRTGEITELAALRAASTLAKIGAVRITRENNLQDITTATTAGRPPVWNPVCLCRYAAMRLCGYAAM